jgi:hypothetical protein
MVMPARTASSHPPLNRPEDHDKYADGATPDRREPNQFAGLRLELGRLGLESME